jgi:hypothetical protein
VRPILVAFSVVLVLFCVPVSAQIAAPEGFHEAFWSSPFDFDGGRWTIEGPGWENGQFAYDSATRELICHFNTLFPTTKLTIPLGNEYDWNDDFFFAVVMVIQSAGYEPEPDCFSPISFGLINRETTGTDRCGGTSFDGGDDDTYDMVEWDFWPNVSEWYGGPCLGPSIMGGRVGDAWWENFAFLQNPSDTDLSDEIAENLLPPTGLPLDVPLSIRVRYQAASKLVYIEAYELKDNHWVLLQTRVPPTPIDALNPSFVCNAFAISLYQDAFNPDENTPSVKATLRFQEITFCAGKIWATGLYNREEDQNQESPIPPLG